MAGLGSDLSVAAGTFDVVVANLYADLLEELAPRLAAHLAVAGRLICSGFIETDAPRIAASYARLGMSVTATEREDGWVTLDLRRAPA